MNDLATLAGEQHQDGVEQTDKRPGREVLEKYPVVPLGACDPLQCEPREDRGAQGDP